MYAGAARSAIDKRAQKEAKVTEKRIVTVAKRASHS